MVMGEYFDFEEKFNENCPLNHSLSLDLLLVVITSGVSFFMFTFQHMLILIITSSPGSLKKNMPQDFFETSITFMPIPSEMTTGGSNTPTTLTFTRIN